MIIYIISQDFFFICWNEIDGNVYHSYVRIFVCEKADHFQVIRLRLVLIQRKIIRTFERLYRKYYARNDVNNVLFHVEPRA